MGPESSKDLMNDVARSVDQVVLQCQQMHEGITQKMQNSELAITA
jgi:hypothetical protein